MGSRKTVQRLHREAPLTDVHAHPSLKAYLFRRNLWRHYWSGRAFNPFSSRSDFRMLERGGVGVLWAAHYVPERQLLEDCPLLRFAAGLWVPVYGKLVRKSRFDLLLEMMDAMEREIGRRPDKAQLAQSAAEVKRIRREGKIAVVHTVEGAHVLEENPERLEVLARRGVAMMTLAHFYANGVADQVDGIPQDMLIRKICKLRFGSVEPALTDFGRELLRRMCELKMLVDLSHCTPQAREAIYQELPGDRPLVASHVGVGRYRPDPYNLSDDEIRHIARSGGAVGVIFMTYWLSSIHPRVGLSIVFETMRHIREVTGSWDHVMLGSDFDGFTDPPDDLHNASRFPALTELLLRRGMNEEDIRKVLGGNAQRLLEAGWR
jgi:membrane dipeptidase